MVYILVMGQYIIKTHTQYKLVNIVHSFLLDGDKGIGEKGRGLPGKRRLLSLKGVAREDPRRQHLKGIK